MPVDKKQPFKQLVFDYHDNGIDFNSYDPKTGTVCAGADLSAAWLLLTKLILRTAKDTKEMRDALESAVQMVDPSTGFIDYQE